VRPRRTLPPAAPPAEQAWAPRAGDVISGQYVIQRLIGKGGMGAVVAAQQVPNGGHVAIKFLHPRLAGDARATERFFREAKATTLIRSEHVVRVFDVGKSEGGLPYIVMELLEGVDLGRLLDSGPLRIPDAVDFILQAAVGLATAHAAGIVHRDLKPSNLWLSQRPDGSSLVKVLDFGISKLSVDAEEDLKLTETQSIFGSPLYMSPEQIRSAKRVDFRTDIWATGIVLYELLTDALPFDADSAAAALAAITADAPASLVAIRPDAPPALEHAIAYCLEKDVNHRCPTLAELGRLLAPFASPIGRIAAEQLTRIPVPAVTTVAPATSAASLRYLGDGRATEAGFSTVSAARRPRGSPIFAVALGIGLACVIVGLVLLGVRLGTAPRPVVAAGPSSVAPLPSVASPVVTTVRPPVTAPPPVQIVAVGDAAPPAPVASASAEPASGQPTVKPTPRTGRYANGRD
jgi:serine/threonine-protein kinase